MSKMLDIVSKLLAHAENAGTPEEAATFMEAAHPDLVAVSEPIPELSVPVWMLTHPELRRTARVRAFMQHVGDALAERLRAGI